MTETSSASSQLSVTVQPNHDIMTIETFSYENLQKAASVASEAHTLANNQFRKYSIDYSQVISKD
jgi:hypothetical protein